MPGRRRSFADRGKDALLTRADAQALVPVVTGQVPLLVHVERASDILVVLELKREVPALKLVLVGANEGWTVARQIAAAKVPVLASALSDLPASFEQLAATQSNIGRMQAAGVTVGIGMINDDEARQARLIKQYAGNLVALTKVPGASGLDWGQAFADDQLEAGRGDGHGRRVMVRCAPAVAATWWCGTATRWRSGRRRCGCSSTASNSRSRRARTSCASATSIRRRAPCPRRTSAEQSPFTSACAGEEPRRAGRPRDPAKYAAIVEAARQAFFSRGFHAATIEEIAAGGGRVEGHGV
jgi:hypothetical protein